VQIDGFAAVLVEQVRRRLGVFFFVDVVEVGNRN
jgi:hypothetical protein